MLDLDENGLSPIEIMSGMKDELNLKYFHAWGCSVLVPDHPNQNDIVGTPKWDPNYREGVCLGFSSLHASSVDQVLNLQTGHVSPRHHLTFDNEFLQCLILMKMLLLLTGVNSSYIIKGA